MGPHPVKKAHLLLLLAALAWIGPASLCAQPSDLSADNENVGPIKLHQDSLDQVLDLMERWTGRTILRPQTLPTAAYSLSLDRAVTKGEAIQAVETLLNMNGVALMPMGERFLKATALNLARIESPPFLEGSTVDLPPSGKVATKLFQLQFFRVAEFLPQISSLLNPNLGAAPIIFERANAALVTDSISNLQRIELLIDKLDHPAPDAWEPRFFTLSFAKASDVVAQIRTVLSGSLQSQFSANTTYQADDRTNQIMLLTDPRQEAFFVSLIEKFDGKADPNTRNEVIFLKNAAAKDVATLLSQLVSGQTQASKNANGGTATQRPLTQPGQPTPENAPAPTDGSTPPPTPVAEAVVTALEGITGESNNQFSSLLTILAEERSNAIVISGTVDDIRLIKDLVEKIDVLLAQVRIEVVIAEVTLTDNHQTGIDALGLKIENNTLTGFVGSTPGLSLSGLTSTTTTTGGTTTTDSSFATRNGLELNGIIRLTTTPRKSNANILSVPTIVTSHNKEASIFVGESRPTISSYLNDGSSSVSGTGYRSTVSSTDIGIELKVKPLIGNDGSVQLEISQEVNDVVGNIEVDGNDQPIIGKRTTESFVSVRSGDIVVLGGLQRTSHKRSTSRLGPIPIIGDLLGSRSKTDDRTDLVFFLRPVVLTNTPLDNAEVISRLEQTREGKATKAILDARPAAAGGPAAPPEPPKKSFFHFSGPRNR